MAEGECSYARCPTAWRQTTTGRRRRPWRRSSLAGKPTRLPMIGPDRGDVGAPVFRWVARDGAFSKGVGGCASLSTKDDALAGTSRTKMRRRSVGASFPALRMIRTGVAASTQRARSNGRTTGTSSTSRIGVYSKLTTAGRGKQQLWRRGRRQRSFDGAIDPKATCDLPESSRGAPGQRRYP